MQPHHFLNNYFKYKKERMKIIDNAIKCFRKNCKNYSIILQKENKNLLNKKRELLYNYKNQEINKKKFKQKLNDLYDNFYKSTEFMNATKCKLQHCNTELIQCLNFTIKYILHIPIKSTYTLNEIKLISMKIKQKLINNDLKNI